MWEIILVFMVVLLLFGAKRLPEIGSSLGKGIREFKGSLREIEGELTLPEERTRKSSLPEDRKVPEAKPDSERETVSASDDESEDENNGEPRRLTTSG